MVVPAATVFGAGSHLEHRLQNNGNNPAIALPNQGSIFLPTGCMCSVKLTAWYSTSMTMVEVFIVSPSSAVNTNKPPIINTPTQDTLA
jgi:hypothetical protein